MEKEKLTAQETDFSALKNTRRRKHAAALGAFVALFALIGVITTLTAGVRLVRSMLGHEQEIARFEKLITPLVMFDPVPFDTVSEAGDTTLLQASMWQTLLNEDKSVYAFDQNGMLIIPASDIDVAASKLFGSSVSLAHQTFGDAEMTFTYDETSRTYRVPPRGYLGIYTPEVLRYYTRDGFTVLEVAYNSPGYIWSYDENGRESDPEPSKVYYSVLLRNRTGYYITSVKSTDPYAG